LSGLLSAGGGEYGAIYPLFRPWLIRFFGLVTSIPLIHRKRLRLADGGVNFFSAFTVDSQRLEIFKLSLSHLIA